MAVVTIRAVPCQMLRVVPISPGHPDVNRLRQVDLYASYCKCGERFLASTREEAIEAMKQHRFKEWPGNMESIVLECSWLS